LPDFCVGVGVGVGGGVVVAVGGTITTVMGGLAVPFPVAVTTGLPVAEGLVPPPGRVACAGVAGLDVEPKLGAAFALAAACVAALDAVLDAGSAGPGSALAADGGADAPSEDGAELVP
jgi:hypothetical protein